MTAVSASPTSGRIVTLMHDSAVLRDNPLGDPHQRKLSVYLPAAYDSPRNAHRRFITLYDLAGFTSSGLSHLNWRNFDENLPEKLERPNAAGALARRGGRCTGVQKIGAVPLPSLVFRG